MHIIGTMLLHFVNLLQINNRTMKKITLITALLICTCTFAYDWKPQTNEELRSDMIAFAEGFAQRAEGTREGRLLKRFVRQQKKLALKAPYAWVDDTAELVYKLQKLCPPTVDDGSKEAAMRRDIMFLLDFPLHVDNLSKTATDADKEAFNKLSAAHRAIGRANALKALAVPAPAPGQIQIIKVYNSGVILRTSERTIAVDIKWEGDRAGADAIAQASDIFFLSHPHGDHFSPVMMVALASAGKTAILPSDVAPDLKWEGKKVIYRNILEPETYCGIQVWNVTGYQDDIPNNSYIIAFDGWRVMLPGENSFYDRYAAFAGVEAPNLIIEPSWNSIDSTFKTVEGMPGYDRDKTYYIPEHENELYHTVDHRESYRELYSRKDRLGDNSYKYPAVVLMEIGESAVLPKR